MIRSFSDKITTEKRLLWIDDKSALLSTGGTKYRDKIISHVQKCGWRFIDYNFPEEVNGGIIKRTFISNFQALKIYFPIVKKGEIVVEDHGYFSRLLLFNLAARILKNVRTIALYHHPAYRNCSSSKVRGITKFVERVFLKTVVHVIVVSKNTKKEMIGLGVPAKKVSIVPDGFDRPPNHYRKEENKGELLNIICVGTFYYRKGIEYLLKAMEYLKGRRVLLNLVGDLTNDRSYVNRMRILVKELGIGDLVTFHGRVSETELYKLYAAADIFVLPSLWEGFGIVFMEAMFFGLPIVATDVGAVPEMIKGEENGLLVPPADSKALATALIRLIESPDERAKLGQNGRFKCREFLTWGEVGDKFDAALMQISTESRSENGYKSYEKI